MSDAPRTAAQAAGESTEQKIARLERELAAALKAREEYKRQADGYYHEAAIAYEKLATERKAKEKADTRAEKAELARDSYAFKLMEAERNAQANQAKIDRLMLEFCPDEMTSEQKDKWAQHQQAARKP